MSPRTHASALAALLAAALATPTFAQQDPKPTLEVSGTVELAPGNEHQPTLVKVRVRTADGTRYNIGSSHVDEPSFYANFEGREITVRGQLRPAPLGSWSDGLQSLHTTLREGTDPNDYYAEILERAPLVSPSLNVFNGVVEGSTLRTSVGDLELVGSVAEIVKAADGRKVSVRGYGFPADAPTELFVVAVQGKVSSAARYREVQGKKKLKLALPGRCVWVQGTAAAGAPADAVKNIPVRPSKDGSGDDLLLIKKELLTKWTGPGIAYACIMPVVKLWWSRDKFLLYVGTYLPSSAITIGEFPTAATAGKGLSNLGQ